jgi:ComF family protein
MPDSAAPRLPHLAARVALALRASMRWLAPYCPLCGLEYGDPFCAGCYADFLHDVRPRCARCALLLQDPPGSRSAGDASAGRVQHAHDLCGRCRHVPPAYDATIALADYAPPVDGLVKALKFGHRLDIARALGVLLGRRALAAGLDAAPDRLVPVPLAFERQAERGFNQAHEIARAAARAGSIPLAPGLLLRTRHCPPQESLDLPARRRNVSGAFVVPAARRADARGRSIAVLDDVMTSGSTLAAAAAALKDAGAARIVCLVVARTP